MELIKTFLPIIVALVSFQISALIYPLIIKRSYKKNFFKKSNHRTTHKGNISTLGGIGIFVGFFVAMNMAIYVHYADLDITTKLYALLFPLLVVFFLGVWDDLTELKARDKLLLEVLAAICLLILNQDIIVSNLGGIMGIGEINEYLSYFLCMILIFVLINSVNLLDGIDGLVGGYMSVAAVWMFLIYFSIGLKGGQIITASVLGALVLYLYYNMFHERKLFMGDSGSLVLGLLLVYFALDLLNLIQSNELPEFTHEFSWAYMLLALPIIDTTRVVLIRFLSGNSITSADKNHIHHRYLSMGLNHQQATSILLISTITLWIFGFLIMDYLGALWHLITVFVISIGLYLGPIVIYKPLKNL